MGLDPTVVTDTNKEGRRLVRTGIGSMLRKRKGERRKANGCRLSNPKFIGKNGLSGALFRDRGDREKIL